MKLGFSDWIVISFGEIEAFSSVDELGSWLRFWNVFESAFEADSHGIEFIIWVDLRMKTFVERGTEFREILEGFFVCS